MDNPVEINQGGQIRGFIYHALSGVKSKLTPDGGTVTFIYADFAELLKRTHQARGVETHYTLNRPIKT